jgi:hypothetical protein
MTKTEKRTRLQHHVKIGIIKQLYKDSLITNVQYQLLIQKYNRKMVEKAE